MSSYLLLSPSSYSGSVSSTGASVFRSSSRHSWPACLFAGGSFRTVLSSGQPIHYYLGAWSPPWGIEYVVDHLNGLVLTAIAIVSLLAALYAKSMIEREIPVAKHAPFYALFLLQVTGLFGMTVTGDMFNLYVLLEIASFSAYALIGMGKDAAPFAAFRYMIFGTLGACAYLLGVGYLYMITGSLNMADLRQLLVPLYQSPVLFVGFAFLLVGIGVKMALFPVHTWLPDSYTLAPSSVSVLLAPLFTKVGAYVMIRVLFTVFDSSFSTNVLPATVVLGWVAVVGIIFSSIMALAQTDLKRMLCYLIVTEIGYIVIGVASGNRTGLTGSIFHIVNDMFMMGLLFMVAGAIQAHFGHRKDPRAHRAPPEDARYRGRPRYRRSLGDRRTAHVRLLQQVVPDTGSHPGETVGLYGNAPPGEPSQRHSFFQDIREVLLRTTSRCASPWQRTGYET